MTILDDNKRLDASVSLVRFLYVKAASVANLDTDQIRAAVNAIDDWADANAASYNNALPTAFKNGATAKQKAVALAILLLWRAGIDPEGVF